MVLGLCVSNRFGTQVLGFPTLLPQWEGFFLVASVQTNTPTGNESQCREGLGFMASAAVRSVSTSEVELVTLPAVPLTSKKSGSISKSVYVTTVENTKWSEGLGRYRALLVLI